MNDKHNNLMLQENGYPHHIFCPDYTEEPVLTLNEPGMPVLETQAGCTGPADYSFACINNYVHCEDPMYEDLQNLTLGMAAHIENLEREPCGYAHHLDIQHCVATGAEIRISGRRHGTYTQPVFTHPPAQPDTEARILTMLDKAASLLTEAALSEDGGDADQMLECVASIRGTFADIGKTTLECQFETLYEKIRIAGGIPEGDEFSATSVLDELASIEGKNRGLVDALSRQEKIIANLEAQIAAQPTPMHEQNARFAIDGAIAFGMQGTNKPPESDHWLMEYWEIGQKIAAQNVALSLPEGENPFASDQDDRKASSYARLRKAYCVQQPLPVPDQAALVWRADLMRMANDLTHKQAFFDSKLAAQAGQEPEATPYGWLQFVDGVKTQNFARTEDELNDVKMVFQLMRPLGKAEYIPVFRAPPAPANSQAVVQAALEAAAKFMDSINRHDSASDIRAIDPQTIINAVSNKESK